MKYFILLLGVVGAAAACSDNPSNTEPFGVAAISRLTGTVTNSDGRPLDSVRIFVSVPNSIYAGYATAQTLTNSAGKYVVDVQRMRQLGDPPTPDTVRVEIEAYSVKRRSADGPIPTISVSHVLTFSSNLQTPPVTQLDFGVAARP